MISLKSLKQNQFWMTGPPFTYPCPQMKQPWQSALLLKRHKPDSKPQPLNRQSQRSTTELTQQPLHRQCLFGTGLEPVFWPQKCWRAREDPCFETYNLVKYCPIYKTGSTVSRQVKTPLNEQSRKLIRGLKTSKQMRDRDSLHRACPWTWVHECVCVCEWVCERAGWANRRGVNIAPENSNKLYAVWSMGSAVFASILVLVSPDVFFFLGLVGLFGCRGMHAGSCSRFSVRIQR